MPSGKGIDWISYPWKTNFGQSPAFGGNIKTALFHDCYVFDLFNVLNSLFCTKKLRTDSTCVSDAFKSKEHRRTRTGRRCVQIDPNLDCCVLYVVHVVSRPTISISPFTIWHMWCTSQLHFYQTLFLKNFMYQMSTHTTISISLFAIWHM